ncbi:MAG: tRNA threonylcarbamoyladenosine dehydratase [Bacteroidales bacterium]
MIELTNWYSRTEILLGDDKLETLRQAHVMIVGVGGVGAYAAEMICRAGVGKITIVDGDTVNITNINRQLVALHSTIGEAKVDILGKRLMDINPNLELITKQVYLKDELIDELLDSDKFNFVVDAIDTLSPKCHLMAGCYRRKIKIISSMGAGAKIDPTKIQFEDISKTTQCSLAKAVRKRLQKMGISRGIPVVFTTEAADRNAVFESDTEQNKKSTIGTISYLPAIFGCYLASYVIRKLVAKQ